MLPMPLRKTCWDTIDCIDLTESSDDKRADPDPLPQRNTIRQPNQRRLPLQDHTPLARKRQREDSPNTMFRSLSTRRWRCDTAGADDFYSGGVIKNVRLYQHPRLNDITLAEVLQIDHVEELLISSYAWDSDWLLGPMGLGEVPSTWIVDPIRGKCDLLDKSGLRSLDVRAARHTIHYPPPPSKWGIAHGKFIALFRRDGRMRLVITTANFRRVEWGAPPETHGGPIPLRYATLDNTVFIIDLPLLPVQPVFTSAQNAFQNGFNEYLRCLNVSSHFRARINAYNFHKCADLAFVYSGGPNAPQTGFYSLQQAITTLNLAPQLSDLRATPIVRYQTSALGKVGDTFIRNLFSAVRGTLQDSTSITADRNTDCLFISYPSKAAVLTAPNAVCGAAFSFTMPKKDTKAWRTLSACITDLPERAWLSHAKLIYTTWWDESPSYFKKHRVGGWLYAGSHNMSSAAWGKVSYECGVVIPLRTEQGKAGVLISLDDRRKLYPLQEAWYR